MRSIAWIRISMHTHKAKYTVRRIEIDGEFQTPEHPLIVHSFLYPDTLGCPGRADQESSIPKEDAPQAITVPLGLSPLYLP